MKKGFCQSIKRIFSLVLVVALLLPVLPFSASASKTAIGDFRAENRTEDDVFTILAGSDFQSRDGLDGSIQNTSAILNQIKDRHTIDAFMFCGDYSNNWDLDSAINGYNGLRNTLSNVLQYTVPEQYLIQGNHDPYSETWTPSVGYETDNYGVFCLNEDDYCWNSECSEEKIISLAGRMEQWLSTITVGEKPVFVISHVPLHYSTRTRDIGDAQYAKYLVDVLNEAGQRGLNIFFLYGHNHGGNYDHYLGGASNFITKGDSLWISNTANRNTAPTERIINFTYMNAGFLGYYSNADADGDGVAEIDDALTMSVFEISGDDVTVRRYDAAGEHAVKLCPGSWWTADEKYYGYTLNTDTYPSPYTVFGNDFTVNLPTMISEDKFFAGLQANVSVSGQEDCQYSWEIEDPSVVSVTTTGNATATLRAVAPGTTKITVTEAISTRSESTASSEFYVTVSEGIVEDSGRVVYMLADKLTPGKRYIIGDINYPGLANIITAPESGVGLNSTGDVRISRYDNNAPFIYAHPSGNRDLWIFKDNGTDSGYGYLYSAEWATPWYLTMYQDEFSACLTSNPAKNAPHDWGGVSISSEWIWDTCLLSDTKSAEANDDLWLGYNSVPEEGQGNWQICSGTNWWTDRDKDGNNDYRSTYIYEETPLTAVLSLSNSFGQVAVGADGTAETGTMVVKTWNTGRVEYIPVTMDMLSIDAQNAGTYHNVSITYGDHILSTDYTLVVGNADNVVSVPAKYYYRLTDSFENGKTYLIVNRNTDGFGYAMKSNGYNADVITSEVVVSLDATGVPCITSEVMNNPNPHEWRYTNWGTYNYYWLEQPAYTSVYLNYVEDPVNDARIQVGDWNDYSAYNPKMHTSLYTPGLEGYTTLRAATSSAQDTTFHILCNGYVFYTAQDNDRIWGREVSIFEKIEIAEAYAAPLGLNGKVGLNAPLNTQTGSMITLTYPDGSLLAVPVTVDMLYFHDGKQLSTEDLADPIILSGLTLKYTDQNGKVVELTSDYVLSVQGADELDYPAFPNPGSVRVNKELNTSEYVFDETGVARIDLSTTGVPMSGKMDVLVIVDTSSSVGTNYMENGESRIEAIRVAIDDLIDVLSQPNPDGSIPDVTLAISQFNDYTYFSDPQTFLGTDSSGAAHIPFGDRGIDGQHNGLVQNYTSIHSMQSFNTDALQPRGGTNYDVAFQDAYQIVSARKEQCPDREQIVIFMTDGICFQYNYLSYRHGAADSEAWRSWLLGGMSPEDQEAYIPSAAKDFYHPEGKQWMAEAIKGDPNQNYKVIWNEARDSGTVYNPDEHLRSVPGLGATIYSIGFGIHVDGHENQKVGKEILSKVASQQNRYYNADETEELRSAFRDIGHSVRKAASNAYMMDQMSEHFDLQLGEFQNSSKTKTFESPAITVKTYELYKVNEVGETINGVYVTKDMVGTRKSATPSAVLETVTFNAAGTEAYSDKIDVNGDGTCNALDNILVNGIIDAKYFQYNTNKVTDDMDEMTNLPPETFYWTIGDITEQEIVLSYYVYLENSMGEDNIGVPADVYPTNAYADLNYTNYKGNECVQHTVSPTQPWQTAVVNYVFYLVDEEGNIIVDDLTGETGSFVNRIPVTQPVTVTMNKNVDDTVDGVEIFAQDVLPEGYQLFDTDASYTVNTNSGNNTGGELTIGGDSGTTYITSYGGDPINESYTATTGNFNNTTVWFAVTYSIGSLPDTVVIDFGLSVEINVLGNDQFPKEVEIAGIFSGKYSADGLNNGVGHIVQETDGQPATASTAAGEFGTATLDTEKGTITYTLNTEAGADSYSGMEMYKEDVFSYVVPYTYVRMINGEKSVQERNYYSTVTVIPATSIYYEDEFVEYSVWSYSGDEPKYQWTDVGTVSSSEQAEDRPGEYSFPEVDANNIYGYDGAYTEMATYSMGSAKKVTVDNSMFAEAQFTFYGTGFDVISLTGGTTGTIMVDVFKTSDFIMPDGSNNYSAVPVASRMVDTYYGYQYTLCNVTYVCTGYQEGNPVWERNVDSIAAEGATVTPAVFPEQPKVSQEVTGIEYGWIPDSSAVENLYQVPVMKIADLEYGQYTALITVSYLKSLDHQNKGYYDFYLDAIRIYDPANDGANYDENGNEIVNDVIQDAYVQDSEGWPEYFELRNQIISKNDFDSREEGENSSGIVFIDNTLDQNYQWNYTIADYTNYGPNNELYLAPGQAVAFQLNVPNDTEAKEDGSVIQHPAGIHLAAKTVGAYNVAANSSANISVYDASLSAKNNVLPVNSISSATDLYYDISSLNGKTVVIVNTSAKESGAILSITNIKVTHAVKHEDEGLAPNEYFTVNSSAAKAATLSLVNLFNPEIEAPKADVFTPEKFTVRVSSTKAPKNSSIWVNVITGCDVSYITINGKKITDYKLNWISENRRWSVKVTADVVGEMEITVVCYSSDEQASEPVTKTVTVSEKSIQDMIDGFRDRWNNRKRKERP